MVKFNKILLGSGWKLVHYSIIDGSWSTTRLLEWFKAHVSGRIIVRKMGFLIELKDEQMDKRYQREIREKKLRETRERKMERVRREEFVFFPFFLSFFSIPSFLLFLFFFFLLPLIFFFRFSQGVEEGPLFTICQCLGSCNCHWPIWAINQELWQQVSMVEKAKKRETRWRIQI